MIQNYIFDFYGTLVDIHTDENKDELWNTLIDIYSRFNVHYSSEQLKRKYAFLCKQEIEIMKVKTGYEYPEINLLNVFGDLFLEDGNTFIQHNKEEREKILIDIAKQFRTISRDYIKLYPETINTLNVLKEKGCHLYLLSNAQHYFTMDEIEMVGLDKYFEKIYISSDYQMKKPQKDYLALCVRQNNLNKEETIMIGNEVNSDIKVAYDNEVRSILLNTNHDSKEEIEEDLKQFENKSYYPTIIYSGDIKEVLEVQ